MNVWAEWVNHAANCMRVCLTWSKECRLLICARFRGVVDEYPWKQFCTAEQNPCIVGLNRYILTRQGAYMLLKCASSHDRKWFENACENTYDRLLSEASEYHANPIKKQESKHMTACLILDVRHVREDAFLLNNYNCFKGLLTSRTIEQDLTTNNQFVAYSLYIDPKDAAPCCKRLLLSDDDTHVSPIPISLVGSSHLLTHCLQQHDQVILKNRDGLITKDRIVQDVCALYNKKQDVEFEEEMLTIMHTHNVTYQELYPRMCEVYRIAAYNELDWLLCMSSLYLLQKYRNSEYLCELHKFFYEHNVHSGVTPSFEQRILQGAVERMLKFNRTDDKPSTIFMQKISCELSEWHVNLLNDMTQGSCKRKRNQFET
ncbi:hypothetical protein CYMTET_44684 [Cymbomonas tetramitiformis]|uniref:Uncharacterized protein n=1 Tax=Cymbomonas tetramitiformis TaxID=36881 RepID=A0AAE0BXP0_9CHLO|nr:hypothetical protein CYMTET_46273 [Cymbomonas tetramitiformis]KAK3245863.1 hypothetical protein CYMTET_44684 [Cymbomonas tetramitiformis]